jgi:putative Ca2+/H+ antiporter (TMEM165/GDT1 family)
MGMEAFWVSLTTVAIAEIGDRTQLLTLLLAAKFRRPLPIIAGIFVATVASHAAAGALGIWFGRLLQPKVLDIAVGVSMIGMALWTLKPDVLDDDTPAGSGAANAFVATATAFFVAEIGDKTQIATLALAAAYAKLLAVLAGSTLGMMAANVPVVFVGNAFAGRLPLKAIHYGAAASFVILGAVFAWRGLVA